MKPPDPSEKPASAGQLKKNTGVWEPSDPSSLLRQWDQAPLLNLHTKIESMLHWKMQMQGIEVLCWRKRTVRHTASVTEPQSSPRGLQDSEVCFDILENIFLNAKAGSHLLLDGRGENWTEMPPG